VPHKTNTSKNTTSSDHDLLYSLAICKISKLASFLRSWGIDATTEKAKMIRIIIEIKLMSPNIYNRRSLTGRVHLSVQKLLGLE